MEDRQSKSPSLVRARYAKKKLEVKPDEYGIYKFCDWLPVKRMLEGSSAPVTYRSKGLGKHLGLENLYITFNGYCPAIGARMTTCSFKETEAFSVCARASREEKRVLVVASAGNTARAFAKVCSDNHIRLLLSVPADNLDALWFDEPLDPCVKLIACANGGDYFDAIHLSNLALKSPMFYSEGGAKNIARRDGMATTVLSAVTTIGRIPDYYFQAVGSGTGAIAAWEANLRLIEDGSYGQNLMKLMVSQNAPFVPMYNAWRVDSREMLPYDDDKARRDVEIIDAKVLSNRRPPYGIHGGLYDALKATDGEIMVATNAQARKARELFRELEGVDIYSAAGVATATLIKAVADGRIDKSATVMLNITGGGEEALQGGQDLALSQAVARLLAYAQRRRRDRQVRGAVRVTNPKRGRGPVAAVRSPFLKNLNRHEKLFIWLLPLLALSVQAQEPDGSRERLNRVAGEWVAQHRKADYPRYGADDFREVAANLIACQNPDGGWPKNLDWMTRECPDSVLARIDAKHRRSTLDNRNVYPQLEFLSAVWELTGDEACLRAARGAAEYMLRTQYDNGGWRGWDADAITFNDDIMAGVLLAWKDILDGRPPMVG